MGIDVPSQLAVVGFGDFEVSRCCTPALTTVAVDGALIGRETGLLLIDGWTAPRRRFPGGLPIA